MEDLQESNELKNIQIRLCTDVKRADEPPEDDQYVIIICPTTITTDDDRKLSRGHQLSEGNYFGPIQRNWTRYTAGPNSSLNYIRQAKISPLGIIGSCLPPANQSDEYVPVEQWNWMGKEGGTTTIQPIVVNGASTIALWSGGVTVAQEFLTETVNYLLDARDETLEMQKPDRIRMTEHGKFCLRNLTNQDVGSLS